jgi:dipeptidyl aminopeptidase/acylaminoacyl peptidase
LTTLLRDRRRTLRIIAVTILAALPLALVAQSGGQLSPGTATSLPFTGPGWADKVINFEGYVLPPPELAAAVLAPRETNVALGNPSPDKQWFLDEIGDGPVPMSIFSKPFDELGGAFIDYKANRLRSVTLRNTIGIQIISAADGSRKRITTPANMRVTGARWTPDGKGVAYMTLADDATHVWITDIASNKPRQVTKTPLVLTFVTNFEFINGGRQIVSTFAPDGRTPRPLPPAAPTGPQIRVSEEGERNRLRTFPSLMNTPYDFQLLKWHATTQIGIVDVATGAMTKFGKPEMIRSYDMAPDGKHARVTRMTEPFAYVVPTNSFGQVEEMWDATGTALHKFSERPINLGVQADPQDPPDPTNPAAQPAQGGGGGRGGGAGADNGKRELQWRPDGTMVYLELEPAPAPPANAGGRQGGGQGGGRVGGGGGGGGQAGGGRQGTGGQQAQQGPPRKDRLMQWSSPFSETSTKLLYENPTRINGLRWSPDGSIIFFTEGNVTYAMYLADTTQKYRLTPQNTGGGGQNQGGGDAAAAPAQGGGRGGRGGGGGADPVGTLVGAGGGGGAAAGGGGGRGGGAGGGGGGGGGNVLISPDGTSVYFQGTVNDRANPQNPPKAFLDKVVIKTGERTRLFEGDNATFTERISSILDPEMKKFILSRETAKAPTQQFLYDNGNRKQLTNNEDLFPDLTNMIVQRFSVTRADGFNFRTVVYLPHDYKEGTRLPGFFWFYPREYTSQEQYDGPAAAQGQQQTQQQRTFQQFTSLSKQFLVRLGYAVIENDSPIVGSQGAMNNNYVNDLRNNLAATIDELDKRALVDRTRLAIGGHSYGAFSTVNAMVNTPFFKAGIAGDGAYNRTLTPLGFQTERRDLWEAPNVYLDMSPFLRANQLSGALLMYHGMHDQNVGTDPVNSIRLFHALNGLGKTVALYQYPFEDHGPAARETLLDLWSRWAAWLDKYVKNSTPLAKPKPTAAPQTGRGGH